MDNDFNRQANIRKNEYLLKTEMLFKANKNRWFDDFTRHFLDTCTQIRVLQGTATLNAMSYFSYIMLYNNFINRRYVAEIFVFNEKNYLSKSQQMIGEYDISFLFVYFDEMWDDLIGLRKRYVGKVSARDVTCFMLKALPDFYSYLIIIARFVVMENADNELFASIDKNEIFKVKVGDYMSKNTTVYAENKIKDTDKLAKWFCERLYSTYICGDYSGLDFSGKTFTFADFRWSQFKRSALNNTNFGSSDLSGVIFRGANMERCCMDYCSIYQADFSNANLKNASFKNAWAKAGLINNVEWQAVGFLPTNYRNADLTGADFTGADLTGADFTGAVLNGADFTDAILDNAIFDGCMGDLNCSYHTRRYYLC